MIDAREKSRFFLSNSLELFSRRFFRDMEVRGARRGAR